MNGTLDKKVHEQYTLSHGVKIKAYHADNGVFRANAWVEECVKQRQTLTFAGVNAHHTNGLAEARIKQLQNLARTMLIHANARWPEAITANLWPYTVRMANDTINATPSFQHKDRRSPVQVFSNTTVNVNEKHWKTFGCPTYVLNSNLQQGNHHHKWKARSRVGIYLGRSPQHNKNVSSS